MSDYAYPSGGVEQFVREFLRFAASAYECMVATWGRELPLPEGFEAVRTVQCGDVRSVWAAMDWADVIVVPTSFNVRMLARLAGEYLSCRSTPCLTVVHTSSHSDPAAGSVRVQERWLTQLMSHSTWTVAVSRDVATAVRELVRRDGAAPVRLTVIENGARLSAPLRRPGPSRRRVSFIGRPTPQKGLDLFLRLARELHGTGLEFAANTVSVPVSSPMPSVPFSALLDDRALLSFFAATDLLVVPYRHSDGQPLAVLEALNCGVPVLGFDSPGVGELLRRHHQAVVAPEFPALRRAVTAWQCGDLDIPSVPTGSVASWTAVLRDYAALLAPTRHAGVVAG